MDATRVVDLFEVFLGLFNEAWGALGLRLVGGGFLCELLGFRLADQVLAEADRAWLVLGHDSGGHFVLLVVVVALLVGGFLTFWAGFAVFNRWSEDIGEML